MDPYGLNHHGDENPGLGIRRKQHETIGSRYMTERFGVWKKNHVAELHSVLTIRILNVGYKQKFIITNLHQLKEKVDIKQINQTKSAIYINHLTCPTSAHQFLFFLGLVVFVWFLLFSNKSGQLLNQTLGNWGLDVPIQTDGSQFIDRLAGW